MLSYLMTWVLVPMLAVWAAFGVGVLVLGLRARWLTPPRLLARWVPAYAR